MKHVQVTIDDDTLARVDRVGRPLGLNRSAVVRQALREWLHRRAVETFERRWIAELERSADEASRADAWTDAQSWSEP